MKIYTKTGDTGTTSLLGGTRVRKSDLRIDAYGTIDELNAYIGLLRDQQVNESRHYLLKEIQDRLFTIGSALAAESDKPQLRHPNLLASDVEVLEKEMDEMNAHLPSLRHFVLPGGHHSVSFAHVARTVCRRAERLCTHLDEHEALDPLILAYLNRLSDYLFVLSRKMSQELGVQEVHWKPRA